MPIWDEALDPVVTLAPLASDAAAEFDFWRLAGRKSLQHDGRRLLLTSDLLNERTRVYLGAGLCHQMPYGYLLAAGAPLAMHRSLDLISAFMSWREVEPAGRAYARPAHVAVVHMRALQAYDGVCAGASHRQIATVMFGGEIVANRWEPDSELRAHVRYLIRRARFLVNLGYVTLMTARPKREGVAAPFVDAP